MKTHPSAQQLFHKLMNWGPTRTAQPKDRSADQVRAVNGLLTEVRNTYRSTPMLKREIALQAFVAKAAAAQQNGSSALPKAVRDDAVQQMRGIQGELKAQLSAARRERGQQGSTSHQRCRDLAELVAQSRDAKRLLKK